MENRIFSTIMLLSFLYLTLFSFEQSVNGSETPFFSIIHVKRTYYSGDFPIYAAYPYGYAFNITLKNIGVYASSVATSFFADFIENGTKSESTSYHYAWDAGEVRSVGFAITWLNQKDVPQNRWIKLEVTAVQTQVLVIYFDAVIDVFASPSELDYPQEVTINGKLRNAISGVGIPDQDLCLYINEAYVANIKTDINGSFTYVWFPTAYGNTRIYVVWSFLENCAGWTYVKVQTRTNLSISPSSSTTYIGFKVNISGKLTYVNGTSVPEIPILVSYSVTGGQSWSDIAFINTTTDGSYSTQWIPPATGTYLIKATWTGRDHVLGANATVNLAVAPFAEQYMFSVLSNSTVSSLVFNSTSRELSFSVSGPPSTTGYVNVTIAKSLIADIADLRVYLNGIEIPYTILSDNDSWLLHFTYHHSTNNISICLGLGKEPLITPFVSAETIALIAALTLLLTFLSVYFLKLKRRKHSFSPGSPTAKVLKTLPTACVKKFPA